MIDKKQSAFPSTFSNHLFTMFPWKLCRNAARMGQMHHIIGALLMMGVRKAERGSPAVSPQHLWVPLGSRERAGAVRSREPGTWLWRSGWHYLQHRTKSLISHEAALGPTVRRSWVNLSCRQTHAVVDRLLSVLGVTRVPLRRAEPACRAQCCAADKGTGHPNSRRYELRVWVLTHSRVLLSGSSTCQSTAVRNFLAPDNRQLGMQTSFWKRNAVIDQIMGASCAVKAWSIPVSSSSETCPVKLLRFHSPFLTFSSSCWLFRLLWLLVGGTSRTAPQKGQLSTI